MYALYISFSYGEYSEKGTQSRKYNEELQEQMETASAVNFIGRKTIQWLDHTWRRSEDDTGGVVLEWKPTRTKKISRTTKEKMDRKKT